jgi:glycosyltransferase A (GT-A) superfamily protein (DUF2064 family)
MDRSLQKGLVMTAGLALIPTDDRVIVWVGLVAFLRKHNYTPGAFRAAIVIGRPQAMEIARELVEYAAEKLSRELTLGIHTADMSFQKLDVHGDRAHVHETLKTKEVLLN